MVSRRRRRYWRRWASCGRKGCGRSADCRRPLSRLTARPIGTTYWRRCSGWPTTLLRNGSGRRPALARCDITLFRNETCYQLVRFLYIYTNCLEFPRHCHSWFTELSEFKGYLLFQTAFSVAPWRVRQLLADYFFYFTYLILSFCCSLWYIGWQESSTWYADVAWYRVVICSCVQWLYVLRCGWLSWAGGADGDEVLPGAASARAASRTRGRAEDETHREHRRQDGPRVLDQHRKGQQPRSRAVWARCFLPFGVGIIK